MILIAVILVMTVTGVSATDDIDAQNLTDTDNDLVLSTEPVDDTLSAGESTFSDLQSTIDALSDGSEITLNKNYKFNSNSDNDLTSGICISVNDVTIDGNNMVIDGDNSARIFNITGHHITLKNIIFKNAYANEESGSNGGAILWSGAYGTIKNSTFNNNGAFKVGGAIYWTGGLGTVTDSKFTNNYVDGNDGGAIYWSGSNGKLSKKERMELIENGHDI